MGGSVVRGPSSSGAALVPPPTAVGDPATGGCEARALVALRVYDSVHLAYESLNASLGYIAALPNMADVAGLVDDWWCRSAVLRAVRLIGWHMQQVPRTGIRLSEFDLLPVLAQKDKCFILEGRLNRAFVLHVGKKSFPLPIFAGNNPHALAVRNGYIVDEAFFPRRKLPLSELAIIPGSASVGSAGLLLKITHVSVVFKCLVPGTGCKAPGGVCQSVPSLSA